MEYKNPFSFYDFLGYFIPGAITIYILNLYLYFNGIDYIENIIDVKLGKIDQYVFFTLISYALGHAINYISSITIVKYSNWLFGYPSYFLLNNKRKKFYKYSTKKELNRYINSDSKFSLLIVIKKKMISSNNKIIKRIGRTRLRSALWRTLLWLVLLPISFLDLLLGYLGGLRFYYTNQMDHTLIRVIKCKIEILVKKYNIQINDEFDFHRIINHYYYEHYNMHRNKFDNYVALFGFTRSLSLIFNISAIIFFVSNQIFIGFFFCAFAYIFFMAFMKFYRRYTLEGFMCFIIDEKFKLKL